MAIRLTVFKDKEDEPILERDFEIDNIIIGRDQSSDLTLKDPGKYVSRRHAVIKFQDGFYYLIDKDSRNGTYINNKRIKAEYPYTLDDSSAFVIGEFTIQFSTIEKEVTNSTSDDEFPEKTEVFSNPFREEMDSLMDVLTRIEKKHQEHKELASRDSLREALNMVKQHTRDFETQSVILTGSNNSVEAQESKELHAGKSAIRSGTGNRVQKVLDASLEFFVNIFRFVSKFRTEFVGSTLVQTEDIMSVQNVTELKELLFDDKMSDQEANERIGQLQIEMEKLVAHQMGLLEGYRTSVKQGVPKLTKDLNPAIVFNEISNETLELGPVKIPYKYIPLVVRRKTLRRLEEKQFEFTEEDRGVIEKRYFRPAFIKKYLETVSAS